MLGLLWTTLVYDALAHWVWGGGWLMTMGALDFAGGTVVHISAGFGALALALVIGKRVGYGKYTFEPTNIPMTLLGAGLLWFGWFGFNARQRARSGRDRGECVPGHEHGGRDRRARLARRQPGSTASRPRSGSSPAGSQGWSRSRRLRATSGCRRAL